MDKQLFDDAIGEVPPSTINVDAVITRGRRADRIRRVASPAVAAGVAVVLGIGAVAFTMSGDDDSSGVVAGTQTTSPTAPTKSSTTGSPSTSTTGPATNVPTPQPPPGCASPDLETPAEVNTRLSQVAKNLVQQQRADLQLSANVAGNGRGPLDFGQEKDKQGNDLPTCDRFSSFVAAASTQGQEGKGNIVISIGPAFFATPPGATCDELRASGAPYCEMVTGPHGEVVMKHTEVQENGITTKQVDVVRPDGTQVIVQAENAANSVKSDENTGSPLTPLDYDQLIAIGSDPALTLFP